MDSLHHQRVDHDLGAALRGIQNHAHDQRRLVVVDHKGVGEEDGAHKEGIKDEVGDTTMLQNGEGIGDVTKHELSVRVENGNGL